MSIKTFSGGNLGNQLYYALQAYISKSKYHVYTSYGRVKDEKQKQYLSLLGCERLLSDDPSDAKVHSYCQQIGKDFQLSELNSFIDNIILKSKFFKDRQLDSDNLYVCIRNGDYLNIKQFSCFDRERYFADALKKYASFYSIAKIVVVSDELELCRKYHSIFSRYSSDICYLDNSTQKDKALADFRSLCYAKQKIIMNSTFHYWSSFISNRLFPMSENRIYCPDIFYREVPILYAANPQWTIIQTKIFEK